MDMTLFIDNKTLFAHACEIRYTLRDYGNVEVFKNRPRMQSLTRFNAVRVRGVQLIALQLPLESKGQYNSICSDYDYNSNINIVRREEIQVCLIILIVSIYLIMFLST